MTTPAAPHTAPEAPPTPPPASGSERFFLWIAGLGVARSDGWLGGVAAGVAARLRIDPLIVRGVLVIAVLFGLPLIFLYAAAWALLPDADGRVHTRDLLRRDFQPVQLGILATAVVGLIPTTAFTGQLFGLSYPSWSALTVIVWIVGMALAVLFLVLIVRAARGAAPAPTGGGRAEADAATADANAMAADAATPHGTAVAANAADLTDAAQHAAASGSAEPTGPDASDLGAVPTPSLSGPPAPPAPLPAGEHDPDEVAAWRAQHQAWREQNQAWRRQQQDADRAARDQLRRERQALAGAFAAEAAERRRFRRATNPRASFAAVAAIVGLSIVAGAAVGLARGADLAGAAAGLLAAAAVLGLGMIVCGLARRRSGFLALITMATLAAGGVTAGVSSFDDVTFGSTWLTNAASAHVKQPFGDLSLGLEQHEGAPRQITIEKGDGQTRIDVQPGVQLDLHAVLGSATVTWMRIDGETGEVVDNGRWAPVARADGALVIDESASAPGIPVTTIQPVALEQRTGDVTITIYQRGDEEQE